MKRRVITLVVFCLLACAGDPQSGDPRTGDPEAVDARTSDSRTGAPANPDVAALIPSLSALPGWSRAEETTEYDPETLFEYLNGAAPAYLAYGFQRLAHTRFALGGDELSSITLDVYDMVSKRGAFGIYSSGRPRDIVAREWGAEGYRLGAAAAAWKGRIYIHALADHETPPLISGLERIVENAIDAAPGDASPPEILRRLPAQNLIPYTTRYVAKDLLGHAFLPGGLLAQYECGTEECRLFLCELESAAAARQAMEKLHEYESRQGTVFELDPELGRDGFRAEDPGLGPGLLTRLGPFVAGVWGGESREVRETLFLALVRACDGP